MRRTQIAIYYILASKVGYNQYSTLEAKPNAVVDGVSDSYIQNGIIHVGQTIVPFSFGITQQSNGTTGGGSTTTSTLNELQKIIPLIFYKLGLK